MSDTEVEYYTDSQTIENGYGVQRVVVTVTKTVTTREVVKTFSYVPEEAKSSE
jgi:hypothetical protein